MRALIFDGTGPRLDASHPEPVPGPGDAVVRTVQVGVGGTDRAVCRGLLGFTGVLGREFVGVVESISGPDDAGLTGRRVVGAATTYCRACDMCQAGLRAHCRSRTIMGLEKRPGCLAERFALPAVNLVPVPDGLDDDRAAFAQPLAAALQAVRQLTIEGKPYITVLGDGGLGLLMVQVMAKLNASVRLVGRAPEKLAVCEKWGIKHRHVDDVGRRADQDIVVDCTGTPAGFALALRLVRPRGTVVLKSLVPSKAGDGADLLPVVFNEIQIVGSAAGPVAEAVPLLASGAVDVVSLISRRASLDDAASALERAARPGEIRMLVKV